MPKTTKGGPSNVHLEREPDYVPPVQPQEPEEEPQEAPESTETVKQPEGQGEVDALLFNELRAALKARGLPAGGTRQELRDRLAASDGE